MARLTIREQIKELEEAQKEYPEYKELLELHRCTLQILLPIENHLNRGDEKSLVHEEVAKLKNEIRANVNAIGLINAEIFCVESFSKAVKETIICLQKRGENPGLGGLVDALEIGEVNPREGFEAVLREDSAWFREMGEKHGLDASLLLFMFSTPMRPFFEGLARELENDFRETWLKPHCPVCGRVPVVARARDRKRLMTCSYCGAEYVVDQFLCVHCGNNDPNSLGFIAFEGHPWFELDYCDKCKHYVKVIFDERVARKIPRGLEDLLTQDLDSLAVGQEFGLERA